MMMKYMSEKKLAQRWDISHRTLQGWRVSGEGNLPFVKIGKCVRYPLEAVEIYEVGKFRNLISNDNLPHGNRNLLTNENVQNKKELED